MLFNKVLQQKNKYFGKIYINILALNKKLLYN